MIEIGFRGAERMLQFQPLTFVGEGAEGVNASILTVALPVA